MSFLHSATIEGYVTHNPETRMTKTGKNVCQFSVAINHYLGAEREPQVSYIDVETWEKLADVCAANVAKGRRVIVVGTLRQDRWDDAEGKKHSKIKIVGRDVKFVENVFSKEEKAA